MKILVIGNGFDLAHELETKYDDFLGYVAEISAKKQGKYAEEYTNLKGDSWIMLFHDTQLESKRWEGFENEITEIVQEADKYRAISINKKSRVPIPAYLENALNYFGSSNTDGRTVSFEMIETWKQVALDELDGLIRQLELYFATEISNKPIDIRLKDIASINADKVLTFNYTNTYERLYGGKPSNICYIHGKATASHNELDDYSNYEDKGYSSKVEYRANHHAQQCNMVLGIDEYQDEYDSQINNEFIRFKKFYQRIVKGTGSEYRDWLAECKEKDEIPEIFFFGHSLSLSDKDILIELIEAEKSIVTFFYRDKESLGRTIESLVRLVGEEKIISRAHGKNATIRFKKQGE